MKEDEDTHLRGMHNEKTASFSARNLVVGILSEANGEYCVDSESENSAIAPGQTLSFGFCSQKVGTDY